VFKIEAGPWSVWTRTLEGTYPNWRHVVPESTPERVLSVAQTDVELLRTALPALPGHDTKDASVVIEVRRERVAVKGRNADDTKWSLVDLPDSRCGGSDVTVAVNRRYLLDALNAGFRLFEIASGDTPIVGRSTDALHVLMPMRIQLDESDNPASAPTPVAEAEPVKENPMPEKKSSEPGALDRLIAAFDAAKAKVKEANEALSQVAGAIKEALKEDRQRRAEIVSVRSGLAKLQAIRV
jgi:pyruvate/2-oxoglutarate dehydrogenase complex dihydrolipoamide acyltransferase (E2) component